jgi:iron complex transport system substrate-binding protein
MRITGPLRHIAVTTALMVFFTSASSRADITVIDDSGHRIVLSAPAKRIVSLAPHVTELLFAAGAGKSVIAATDQSDFPPAALQLPSIGAGTRPDLERIASLKPDLVVAWKSGINAQGIARLRAMGIPVFLSEPNDFSQIATSLERLGALAGSPQGKTEADKFRKSLSELRSRYAGRESVTVFYQIWSRPLMTLNDTHLAGQVLQLCGAKNIFGHLPQLAPVVSIEAVLQADPAAIILTDNHREALRRWNRHTKMRAVAGNQLLTVDGTLLNRASPRILQGTAILCDSIDRLRSVKTQSLSAPKEK